MNYILVKLTDCQYTDSPLEIINTFHTTDAKQAMDMRNSMKKDGDGKILSITTGDYFSVHLEE